MITVGEFTLKASVEDVVEKLRMVLTNGKLREVKEKNEDLVVTCPFHDGGHEATASCFVRKSDGVFHCFSCDTKGSFLKFVAGCFGSNEDYAKQWLSSNFDCEISKSFIQLDPPIVLGKNLIKTNKLDPSILDTYLPWHPYLGQRKLSKETCEKFNVKYDPKYRQVIFPCYDAHGDLVMMPKRSIDTKTFYLDKNQEKPVYCLNYIIKDNIRQAIITEGPFDCLTSWEYGYPAIATLGRLSDYQISQINKSCLNIIYAMFDNDVAGRSFLETLKKKLDKRILVIDVQIPNNKKDINELSKQEFWQALEKAKNSEF